MNPIDKRAASQVSDAAVSDIADSDAGVVEVPRLSVVLADTLGELVEGVAAFDRVVAWALAGRAEAIDHARRFTEITENATALTAKGFSGDTRALAKRVLVTELACILRLPERTAESLVAESEALMHELPATREALRAGEISYRHAQTMIDHASSLAVEVRAGFEAEVLPHAKTLSVAKFDRKARTARERTDPETIASRHTASVLNRSVQFQPARDGMAWLNAYLPVATALAAYNRISDTAISLQGPDEPRTLTQLRADVFADLLIDSVTPSGLGHGVRANVHVTVPVMTLLGHSEEPGSLEGYGPIDPDTARRLAGRAPSFTRLLTHPETGCVLSVGRERYKVPKDLRRWLRVRDETCRFPGCNRGAVRCDLDHAKDWQYNGRSDHDNLAHLCPAHHALKHDSAWTVTHTQDATLDWVSPSGHQHSTEPATRIRPAPPF